MFAPRLMLNMNVNLLIRRMSVFRTGNLYLGHFCTQPCRLFCSQQKTRPDSQRSFEARSIGGPVNWKTLGIVVLFGSGCVYMVQRVKAQKKLEQEKARYQALGKSLIGGPWELIDHNGERKSSKDFVGKWYMIYFGFTHCPDVCPDEIEKMVKVMELTEKDPTMPNVGAVFFTVDPKRDTPERVKRYVSEFSPKLIGFTGSPEEVNKVCKTFRVYHSQGPVDESEDYIVDHTIIIYLINPDGQFVDYYGQNRTPQEIAAAIGIEALRYDLVNKS